MIDNLKSIFVLLQYMVHVMTQNMGSNKNGPSLPVAGGSVVPQSPLPVTTAVRPLGFRNEKNLIIVLESF